MRALLISITILLCSVSSLYAAENWYKPPVSATWQWQLDGVVNEGYNVDLYDIDLFDSPVALIQRLHASGKKVICYFSAGSYERWLDIRSENVRSIMLKRLDLAVKKGCDGVEPDNVDSYRTNTGFSFRQYDQLAFNRFLAKQAHERGLAIGLKNDPDQVRALVSDFDFAVNEQCFAFSECRSFTAFIKQGKPVLNAEYRTSYVNNAEDRAAMCKESLAMQFSTLILPVKLDDSFRISCQP